MSKKTIQVSLDITVPEGNFCKLAGQVLCDNLKIDGDYMYCKYSPTGKKYRYRPSFKKLPFCSSIPQIIITKTPENEEDNSSVKPEIIQHGSNWIRRSSRDNQCPECGYEKMVEEIDVFGDGDSPTTHLDCSCPKCGCEFRFQREEKAG
jgi:DNA-directed RNA polymerase subunit M/transcription elongation factor TFIIS